MNRIWLCISMLIVSLAGAHWLAAPALGESDNPCPSADTVHDGRDACPCWDGMRAYGECRWYGDEGCHHGTMPEVTDTVIGDGFSELAEAKSGAAEEAPTTTEAPAANAAAGPADCWYDGATDTYHDYEFSNAEMIREETAETATEAVGAYAADGADEATEGDWSGSYEFPSETVASEQAEDIATEEAWYGNDCAEYAYPREGADYAYTDASESEMADTQPAQTTEASEEVMEGACEQNTADAKANESPAAWQSGEYEYDGYPYHCENYHDTYSIPAPTGEDSEPNDEVVEGEDGEELRTQSVSSVDVEFDSEVLLSLARTLDRVGVTLRCLSCYLTEMATADLAKQDSETLER